MVCYLDMVQNCILAKMANISKYDILYTNCPKRKAKFWALFRYCAWGIIAPIHYLHSRSDNKLMMSASQALNNLSAVCSDRLHIQLWVWELPSRDEGLKRYIVINTSMFKRSKIMRCVVIQYYVSCYPISTGYFFILSPCVLLVWHLSFEWVSKNVCAVLLTES